MDAFLNNIWDGITQLAWSDWATVAILISFVVLGFKRGLAMELINLALFAMAVILAWLFYQMLAQLPFITYFALSAQTNMAIAFGLIFLGVLVLKRGFYRVIDYSSSLTDPCAFNRFFALSTFLVLSALLSWHYLYLIASLGIMEIVITNESLRIGLSFLMVFLAFVGVCSILSKVLDISIGSSRPCLLESFFQKILDTLKRIDTLINARNVNSTENKLLGMIVGLIKGVLFILIMVLIMQSISWIADKPFWLDATGAFQSFQDLASSIKPEVSKHLLFINSQ